MLIGVTEKGKFIQIPNTIWIKTLREFNQQNFDVKRNILKFLNIKEEYINFYIFKDEYQHYLKLAKKLRKLIGGEEYSFIMSLPIDENIKNKIISLLNIDKKTEGELKKSIIKIRDELLKCDNWLAFVLYSLPSFNKLNFATKKEIYKVFDLEEIGDKILTANFPTHYKKLVVEIQVLKVLSEFDIVVILDNNEVKKYKRVR